MESADRIDTHQLKTLLKVSLKTDLRGAHNPFHTYGKGESKFPPIIGLVLLQLVASAFIAALVFAIRDPFLGAFATNLFVLVFIALTILLEFSNLILSPDDYQILSPHPVNSRTFFVAKAVHFLVFISLLSTAMALAPAIVSGVAVGSPWAFPLTFLSAWLMAITTSLFFILFYTVVLRLVNRETMQRVLGYTQFAFILVAYFGYFVLPRMMKNVKDFDFSVFDRWYLLLTPPAWFASWPSLLIDGFRIDRLLAAAAGILVFVVLIAIGLSRLSLKYALTLADTVEQQEKLVARRKRGVFDRFLSLVANSEDRAIWALIRAQFKFDNRFKTTILSIIPLTILYIYLGVQDGGSIVNPFVSAADVKVGNNFFLYLAVAFLPYMVVTGTSYSSSANASWVFFASPADRTKLVVATARFALVFFCVPYLIFLCAVLTYFFGNLIHSILHCFVLFLMLTVMLRMMVAILPRVPFSIPARAGQRSLGFFAMFIIPTAFIVVPMLIILNFGYGGPIGYSAVVAGLILLGWITNLILKKTAPRRLAKLEYAEA